MRKLLFIIIYLSFISPAFAGGNKAIENTLQKYIKGKDARIGVAVIINGKDTVSVNGNRDFPMMSVVKFPLALTVAHWIDTNGMSLNDTVTFNEKAMKEDTYSPMLKKYGKSRNAMTVRELLEWSLAESDNNAADILLHRVGGTSGVTSIMRQMGISDEIVIGASEEDMHRDPYLSYLNRTTPYRELGNASQSYSEISVMLEDCRTGLDRLALPLLPTNATIGHKTGTGFPTPDGRISAVNDCGYVKLLEGTKYSIAVVVADSGHGSDIGHNCRDFQDSLEKFD